MDAKITIFFQYKTAGTSISLYKTVAELKDLTQTVPGGSNPMLNLLGYLMPLLGIGVEASDIRISDDANSGDALFYPKRFFNVASGDIPDTGPNTILTKAITADYPDFYDTGVLVSLNAGPFHRGRMTLRFIPDSLFQNPVGLIPSTYWNNAFQKFAAYLTSASFQIKSLKGVDINPWKRIDKLRRAGNGDNVTVTTLEAHGFAIGDKVRISRSVGFANGIYEVLEMGANPLTQFVLLDTAGTLLIAGNKGRVRRMAYIYPVIGGVDYKRITRRKAGRPFAAPVGRLSRT